MVTGAADELTRFAPVLNQESGGAGKIPLVDSSGRLIVRAELRDGANLLNINDNGSLDVNILTGEVSIDTTGLATSAKQDTGNTALAAIQAAVEGTLDTELPAAEAASDTLSNPTAPAVLAHQVLWTGSAWRRVRAASMVGDGASGTGEQMVNIGMYNGSTFDRVRGDTTNGLDVDVTRLPDSIDGPGAPSIDSYSGIAINLAAGANQALVAAPGANKQIWIYGVQFSVNAAGTVSFQDEDDTAITGVMPFAANGGMAVNPSGNFAMPWRKLATNKALEVDVVTSELDGALQYAIVSV